MNAYKEALGVPGDVLIIAERGNTEDKQFQIPKLSLSCIFIELHLCLKSLKTYLTMLNIFDLLLSLMQTDNYVYFLLPIDICAVFFYERSRQYQSSVCSYKDTLQLLSGKQFVIVIFIFAFRSTLRLLVRQTGKIECYCLNVSIVFNHFIFLVCLLFFFLWKTLHS